MSRPTCRFCVVAIPVSCNARDVTVTPNLREILTIVVMNRACGRKQQLHCTLLEQAGYSYLPLPQGQGS